ncbi:MAG: NAD(P)-dependent oxidoreductase [Limnobacter sp.]|nr:NAD(P)-dependent oxidoreductase [Limnobacter sp.]
MADTKRVGFIGLGNMGSAMVRHLALAGYTVATWSRSAHRYTELEDLPLTRLDTCSEVFSSCNLICLNVTTTNDVEHLLFGPEGAANHAKPGSLIVDFSTIDASAVAQFSARLKKEHQIDFIDCPVSGGATGARAATLSMMAGGPRHRFDEVEPMLKHLGKTIRYVGTSGAGQAIKAANQMVMCICLNGIAEAMNYAKAQGADLQATLELLQAGLAGSKVLDWAGPHMAEGFTRPASIEARLHAKDVQMVADAARAQGLHLPLLEQTAQNLSELVRTGMGNEDTSRVFEVVAAHLRSSG